MNGELQLALRQLFDDKANQHHPTARPETRSPTSCKAETRKSFESISANQIIFASLARVTASRAENRISLPAHAAKFNLVSTPKRHSNNNLRRVAPLLPYPSSPGGTD